MRGTRKVENLMGSCRLGLPLGGVSWCGQILRNIGSTDRRGSPALWWLHLPALYSGAEQNWR
eukprot:5697557-Prymnesium_polylepis.1